ncbi:MAG TPA: glycoside hydrolase family 2 TIM barrel-domain containing protein [Anaerolineales bacterium]|nr:glycoside hydrolase family 2 TIM barrel-domain containing protein [Anaerolineales bacterium]
MSKRISLNGSDWIFKDFYGEDWRWRGSHLPGSGDRRHWRTGSVPGCPHYDLWMLGEIPDPYIDRNSLLSEWIPQRTWLYKKSFVVGEDTKGKRIQLHFEGVDYQAEFFLNGESLGRHTGMFTPVVFEVTDKLYFEAENILAVVMEPAPMEEPQVGRTSRVKTVKTRMNYWWDFCPRMVHLGIWDDVYLEVSGPVRLDDVFVRPRLEPDFQRADIFVTVALDSLIQTSIVLEVTLRQADGGAVVASERISHELEPGQTRLETCLEIVQPRLWWPNGCGDQDLYEADVRIVVPSTDHTEQHDNVSAARTVTFGVRQVSLAFNETAAPDALGYTFVVNGRKVYAKGWNWVPMDVMYSVPQQGKLERLLTLAKRANVNLLRIWGGGLIEKEAFYEQCDRLGIMVWQEFIQSSSGIDNIPSTSPEYIQLVAEAAEYIVPRKRNHPSLVIWCGGNELSGERELPLNSTHPVLAALKTIVERLDPDRLWLPTSPSGHVFGNTLELIASDPTALHDIHGPWEYQGATEHYALYNQGASLLHSEFGVEGITNPRTLNATMKKEHQWPVDLDNPVWFHRGAWWVKRPMWDKTFGKLQSIEELVRATQFTQADGLRYALESDRRRKYHNSGTLPWQFNEPYPMAACTSAVDYYARPKPSYYTVGRAYAPLLLSARFATSAWGDWEQFEAEAWVSNSHERSFSDATLQMRLMGTDGSVYAERAEVVSFGANCSARLAAIQEWLSAIPDEVFFLDLQLFDSDGTSFCHNRYVFSRTTTLAPLLECAPATLQVTSSGTEHERLLTLTNSGKTAAMFVWLEDSRDLTASGYLYFDDNYFCLLPGESRMVKATWTDVPARERQMEISGWNTDLIYLDLSLPGGV